MPSSAAILLLILEGPTGLPAPPVYVPPPFRPRLVSAGMHDAAQDLRNRYAAQLLALEQLLPAAQWTYDAGAIAARLVAGVYELHLGDGSYDGTWLSRYFPPDLVAARLGPGDATPPFDDLLAYLGIGGQLAGTALGFQTVPSATPVVDIDAALAAF
jgi:hypothetical protein